MILFSVKLIIKELQILLSELIHVQLFQQYICKKIKISCKDISDLSGEASVILSRVLLEIQPYNWFSYLYFPAWFSFQESPNATAGACLRKSSPPCWWWCHWISVLGLSQQSWSFTNWHLHHILLCVCAQWSFNSITIDNTGKSFPLGFAVLLLGCEISFSPAASNPKLL